METVAVFLVVYPALSPPPFIPHSFLAGVIMLPAPPLLLDFTSFKPFLSIHSVPMNTLGTVGYVLDVMMTTQ